jgi:hypothetical protein
MSEVARKTLEYLVERAVAPVHADVRDAMREELLGHVLTVYDEELARTGDEAAALKSTCDRFGYPASLSRELQESWRAPMANHRRLYNMLMIVLWIHTLVGIVFLAAMMTLPPSARPTMLISDSVLPLLTAVNAFYLGVITITLIARLRGFASESRLTAALNLMLLPALPLGTALGIYGLWSSRRLSDRPA